MDFKQIEAFAAVMEQKSFSKAAQSLYLTQPTVSAHISLLERELGVKLLIRTTKELTPTDAGVVFYEYARKLIDLRAEACSAVLSDGGDNSTVSVAASTVPAQNYLPKLTAAYMSGHPNVAFQIFQGNSSDAEAMLLGGKAELALMGRKPVSTRCIAFSFADDSLAVITPNTSRYRSLRGDMFPLDLLLSEPFISRESGSGTRLETEQFLRRIGIDPQYLNTVMETRSTEAVKKMVSEGAGIAIISKAASDDYADFGKILSFSLGGMSPTRKLYVVKLRSGIISRSGADFFEFVKASASPAKCTNENPSNH